MRSLIYSTNRLFGQCLLHGLAAHLLVESAQYATDLDEAIDLARRSAVTSVLVDLGDPAGAEALATLADALPDTAILALSVDDRVASEVIACARLGCCGFVSRDATLDDLVRIIRAAERGEVAVRPNVAALLMKALATDRQCPRDPPECLTRREREVCSLVCEGLTNKEIARELNRSLGTVKNHVGAILTKLDVPRRAAINGRFTQRTPVLLQRRD